ncbi:MAG: hypothetical protein JNM88_00060, partial [Chitinophagaceae bacterium]|nr:hypothetical protein [Chitinophagaceae bacterium]
MHPKNITFIFLPLLAAACTVAKPVVRKNNIEIVDYRFRQYTHEDTFLRRPFWDITERVWVKDSVAIEEVRKINIVSDSKGDTTTYPIMMYRYTNLKTAEVYEFNAFLERSTLRRKYMLYDTVSVASGWGFKVNRRLSEGASIQFLPDTIVNGKKYL